ncbi:ribbon-helix-helix protein, CopG family [Brasilonema sp. CT11]|nr:ribbon-helix-helix protein, CopG family [Brasilonema sp. CT11]
MSAEKRKYRGVRYSVVLAKPIAEQVEALAEKEGRSISQMIAKLVEESLERRTSES